MCAAGEEAIGTVETGVSTEAVCDAALPWETQLLASPLNQEESEGSHILTPGSSVTAVGPWPYRHQAVLGIVDICPLRYYLTLQPRMNV